MLKKSFLITWLLISFSIFCFGDDEGSIYGWRTEGTFTINSFTIINLTKANNNQNNKQIENDIAYGETFLFSTRTYSELILVFFLKNGGKIEIKCYQEKPITEQVMFTEYKEDSASFFKYARRLTINGFGTFREFDRDFQIIKEKRNYNVIGLVNIFFTSSDQSNNNEVRNFTGEGVYRLTLDSNIEAEIIEIKITPNSPYSQ
jgi:hypothetical protein